MNSIANNIKKIREAKHLTQEYLASLLGISQNAYSRIENNKTRMSTERMRQIAHILNVSLHELLINENPVAATRSDYILSIIESQKDNFSQTIGILKAEIEYLRRENIRLVELLDEKISKRL